MKKHNEFLCGFAVAVASLVREHDQPSMAMDIMTSNGVTLKELIAGGVDEYDLKPIRKMWKDERGAEPKGERGEP